MKRSAVGECTSFKGTKPGNTPDGYRAMWRHTRDIFDAAGVTNVVWVMNYMGLENWDCMIRDLWPEVPRLPRLCYLDCRARGGW